MNVLHLTVVAIKIVLMKLVRINVLVTMATVWHMMEGNVSTLMNALRRRECCLVI